MSYAQVKVRFANDPELQYSSGITTGINLGGTRMAPLYGYISAHIEHQQAVNPSSAPFLFTIYTNAFKTANSYRQKFLAAYGPNGHYSQNDITVSPVMAEPGAGTPFPPLYPYYIIIGFNYYLGEDVRTAFSMPISMEVTQEVMPNFEVLSSVIGGGANCGLANFTLSVHGGTAPFAITRGGQLIANSLTFDFSRSDAARDIVVTDADGQEASYTLPFVREYFFGQITQVPKAAGTDITIGTTNSGLGSPLTLEYSVDGINWQSSNFFPLVEPGPRTIYLRDALGCEKQLDIVVEAFQFIDVRSVHNPVNFEITRPSAEAPAWLDIAIEMDGALVGTYKAHPWRIDGSNTIYLFSADEPIRQYMPAIDDYPSQINSAALVQNMQARVVIKERTPGTAVYNEVATFIEIGRAHV